MGLVGRGAGQAKRESGQSTLGQCWGHTRSPPSHLASERRRQAEVAPAWLRPIALRNLRHQELSAAAGGPRPPRSRPSRLPHPRHTGRLLARPLESKSWRVPAAAIVRKGIVIHKEDVLGRPLAQWLLPHLAALALHSHFAASTSGPLPLNQYTWPLTASGARHFVTPTVSHTHGRPHTPPQAVADTLMNT